MNTIPVEISSIYKKVYALEDSLGIGKIDHLKFEDFIKSVINGDVLKDFIVFPGTYGEKNEKCLLVYILTSGKLSRIRMTANGFASSSAYLNQIIGVNKRVSDDNKDSAEVIVEFPQGRIGLTYSLDADAKWVDNFFQEVDKAVREQGKANG